MWGGVAVALVSLHGAIAAPPRDTLWSASEEVPFVAQGPLLCGGAAAAMIQRFWGARGVYGEDYQHLVRASEGGIRTSELTTAIRDRGYATEFVTGEPDRAFAALRGGVPPILLLESGATRLHYVVLVEVNGGTVWVHDPNFGPRRPMSLDALMRRWTASGYWALLVTPASGANLDAAPAPEAAQAPPLADPPSEIVRTPALVEAMERLRSNDLAGARSSARALIQGGTPEAELGRRILATAWYLGGEHGPALAAWNELGEPAIDLVRIDGMTSTRHHVAAERMALGPGEVLTTRSLELARRRLAQLPVTEASRVDYRPLADGTVEVRASVLERSRLPGFPALALQSAAGLAHQRAGLEAGSLVAGGERWRASGSWAPAQRHIGGSLSAPAPPFPGIVTVGAEWRRERFSLPGPTFVGPEQEVQTEVRSRGFLEIEEWVLPRLRLGAHIALESWEVPFWMLASPAEAARLVGAGLTGHFATGDDRSWLTVRGERWTGSGRSFTRTSLAAGGTVPHGDRREWRLRAGGIAASSGAPRTLWPGAGTGRIRDPLLRAHGLVDDGVIQGPAFGRELLHATVEHRVFRRAGPLRLGAALFIDAAHTRSRGGGLEDGSFVSVGGGLVLALGSQEGAVSLARGSSGWRLSTQIGGRH
ncbi:MAG TPA: papain-like cysteine protease family protein [Longimicrobiaceae bacterium]|nr:papain-like cysteine protease family protein [Longimicrobiaceae bacterium]